MAETVTRAARSIFGPDAVAWIELKAPDGRSVRATAKAYEALLKGSGFTLVDPASYVAPKGIDPLPPSQPESISRKDAAPLDKEQVANAPEGKK